MLKAALRLASVIAALSFSASALAQGPGPGPTPTPSPWTYAAPAIYAPAGSCITLPQTVTGGCPAGGNAINVSGGYYINGAQIQSITTTPLPLQFSSGTLSLNINSSLIVSGSNLGINLGNVNTWTVSQQMASAQGFWDIRSASGGNSAFIALTPNGVGAQRFYSGIEGTTNGQLLAGDGPLDAVLANTTVTGGIDFGTNAILVGKMYPSGGFYWGTSITDPGANNMLVQGAVGVGGAVPGPGSGRGWIGASSSNGLTLTGNGSTIDVLLENSSNAAVCYVAHNQNWFTCQNSTSTANTFFVGVELTANQPATVNNQFYSPALYLVGEGWKTNATAGNVEVDWAIYNQPIQGAAAPESAVIFASRTGSNAFATSLQVMDGADSLPSVVVGAGTPISGADQGDLQVGRGVGSTTTGFIFFDSTGNEFLGFNGTFAFHTGSGSVTVPNAADTVALLGTVQTFSAVNTFSSEVLVSAGSAGTPSIGQSGATSTGIYFPAASEFGFTAAGTLKVDCGITTAAVCTSVWPWTYNVATTIASATAATLDDVKVSAATTTITGNTGSPITALSKVHLGQPTFTDSSAVTVTTAATLTIDNAPAQAGSVTITNAYALNVVAGSTLLGGKVFMSGLTAGSGTKAMCINATANEVQTDTSATICGISALRYKNLISEITPDQGLGILTLRGETYRYKPDVMQDAKVHVSLIADDMSALNHDCAEYSAKGVENYMDRCFEAYQVAYDKKLWEIIGKLTSRLPANDGLRDEVQTLRR